MAQHAKAYIEYLSKRGLPFKDIEEEPSLLRQRVLKAMEDEEAATSTNKATAQRLHFEKMGGLVRSFEVGPLQCNMTIVADPQQRTAVVIDPGGDADQILKAIKNMGVKVSGIYLTHGHFDHCLAAQEIHKATGAPIFAGAGDVGFVLGLDKQCMAFGMRPPKPEHVPSAVSAVDHGAKLGVLDGVAIHTPGHSPGSTSYYFRSLGLLLSGDTLFQGSIGRTDLMGGSLETITTSIQERLYVLPDAVQVIPGHGPATTIGRERKGNMFVRGAQSRL